MVALYSLELFCSIELYNCFVSLSDNNMVSFEGLIIAK